MICKEKGVTGRRSKEKKRETTEKRYNKSNKVIKVRKKVTRNGK